MIRREQRKRAASKPRARRKREIPGGLMRGLRVDLVFCFMLALAFLPATAAGQDLAGEYELKAAMLYNLTRFVGWPPAAYPDPQAPTILCILGRDPFGPSLTSMISEQVAKGGRGAEVRHVKNDKSLRACHVVYISSSERKSVVAILAALKGSSVLTVGEMAQFAARGGMIQFSLQEQQVRFEINLDAASQADLKISSRLLLLARIVKDQDKNPSKEGSALWSQGIEVASLQSDAGRGAPGQSFKEAGIATPRGDEPRAPGRSR